LQVWHPLLLLPPPPVVGVGVEQVVVGVLEDVEEEETTTAEAEEGLDVESHSIRLSNNKSRITKNTVTGSRVKLGYTKQFQVQFDLLNDDDSIKMRSYC